MHMTWKMRCHKEKSTDHSGQQPTDTTHATPSKEDWALEFLSHLTAHIQVLTQKAFA